MKNFTSVFLLSSLLMLSSSPAFSADKDKSMLDALSEEAKETSMDEGSAPDETSSEPSVVPKSVTDFSGLEGKIAAQIKGLLVDKTKDSEEEQQATSTGGDFQNKLENIVSGALLKGNKLDDIRNAVSAAMVNIKSEGEGGISAGTIESATKALKSIVGENKVIANGDKQDSYIQSLQAELSDDSSNNDAKSTESTPKKVLKTAVIRDVAETVPTKKPEVSSSEIPTATSETTKADKTDTVLADTVTVLEGETLFKIAQRVYGSGANYLALYEANKDIIKDPNLIRVGQVLKIPK